MLVSRGPVNSDLHITHQECDWLSPSQHSSEVPSSNKSVTRKTSITALSLLASALIGVNVLAADSVGEPGRSSGDKNPLKNVYFGEQHLHTQNSPDAFAAGGRQTWDDAFRFGRGEEVELHTTATKNKIKRRTPYDFMAITDHAEYFSVMPQLIDPKNPLSKTDFDQETPATGSECDPDYFAFHSDEHGDA